MQQFLEMPSPSPDQHRTKSAESCIEPGQHPSGTLCHLVRYLTGTLWSSHPSPARARRSYSWLRKKPGRAWILSSAGPPGLRFTSLHRTVIKMTFFGILRSNWCRNTSFFCSKIPIWKFDLVWPGGWPDHSLSLTFWGRIAKWLRFMNSTCKSA